MAENMKLSINTGAITIDIVNEKGKKLGEFEFIPTDSNILKRYEEVVDAFNQMDDLKVDTAEDIRKVSDVMEKQIDHLLGTGASEKIFSVCGPLTIVSNGDFFIENVLDGIGSLIEKVFDQRAKKKMAKLKKATAAYHE